MMNALALGFVLTSLLTGGFFTPTPEIQNSKDDDVIVKEGRRVVVVEYENDVGNTKVSISPQDSQSLDDSKEKLSEKIEGVKEFGKEKIEDVKERRFRPRELVCDAYGKCKHKIASVIGKTADTAAETAEGAVGKVMDKVEEAKEKVSEKASGIKEEASRRMEGAKEKVSEKASGVEEEASRRMEGAKEKVSEKASGVKEEASRMVEGAKEEASRRVEGAKEKARKVKKEGEKEVSGIMRRARDVVVEVFSYVFSAETVAPATGVLHLMGFAAAYGMCVWVTFASSDVLAGALPRGQFAMVQSRIYPLYFKGMGYSVGLALLGHLMSPRKDLGTRVGMLRGFDLMAALALILVNLLYLEPRATKVMHEKMKIEKEEGTRKETEASARAQDSTAETAGRGVAIDRAKRDEAAAKAQIIHLGLTLQRLNSYSSFLNVMTLVSLTWHLVRLGSRLHTVC
ncbi:hypothetical protein ACS0TY_027992 [Phlomoides rotata]